MPSLKRCLTLPVIAMLALAVPPAASADDPPPASFGYPAHLQTRAGALSIDDDAMQDCSQLTPQRAGVSGVTDEGQTVGLDILVLIDTDETLGVAEALRDADTDEERAAAEAQFQALVDSVRPLIAPGAQSYEPLDIEYRLAFDLYAPFAEDGSPRNRTEASARDSQTMIDLAKTSLGGTRPEGVDVVYVLTDLDITAPGLGSAVIGQADCIGGVAWGEHAFAVGEIFPGIPIGPITFYREGTAKVMAHELGHLMGAHHHYQSCGAEAVGETLAGGFGTCSLMTNAVDFQAFPFSVLSGAVVRAHAVDFADQPPG